MHAGRTALGLMHPFSKEKARPLGRSDLDASDGHPLRSKIAIVMAGHDVSRSCDFSCCPALFSAVTDVPIVRTLKITPRPSQASKKAWMQEPSGTIMQRRCSKPAASICWTVILRSKF